MELQIQVFLVSSSWEYLELLRLALERHPDLTVTGMAARGDEALSQLAGQKPDVLISDLLLPGLDGLSLLRSLKELAVMPRTIVVSGFSNDRMARALSRLGVEDYILKPCSMDALIARVRETAAPAEGWADRRYTAVMRAALRMLGIPLTLDGYKYLMAGVQMALEDRNALHGVTKILYPDLGRRFGVSAQAVERSIRGAVLKCWAETTPEERASRLGGAFARFGTEKPGNARFISALVEHVETGCEPGDIWAGGR